MTTIYKSYMLMYNRIYIIICTRSCASWIVNKRGWRGHKESKREDQSFFYEATIRKELMGGGGGGVGGGGTGASKRETMMMI